MARPVAGARTAASEFFGGVATLFRGFGWWRRRPDLMLLGLVPAAIVFAGLVALLIAIIAGAEGFVGWLTPFADRWDPVLAQLFRVALAMTLLAGFIVIAVLAFTGLTLIVGDWFYERIWLAVEAQLGGFARGSEPGFWRGVADALRLVPPAVLSALVVTLVGFIPVVGTLAGAVLGVVLAGRILARELTARPMEARGLSHEQRRALFRGNRARALGFGVAVQLCFLVPGGAILVMAPAVAGATQLTRDLLATALATVQPPQPPAT